MKAGAAYVNLSLSPEYEQRWWGRAIFRVEHVDVYHRMLQAQGMIADPPQDAPWGERFFHVTDPDGHELSFAELVWHDIGRFSAAPRVRDSFGDIIAGMPRRKKSFDGLSMTDAEILEAALFGLERHRSDIEAKIAELRRQVGARPGRRPGRPAVDRAQGTPVKKKRTRSAAVRRRMAEAQRKRWAALKRGAAEEPQPVKRRRISAAARRRMSEGSKKRWAQFRAK